MFTGLVEGTGRVVSLREGGMARIEVSAGPLAEGVNVGDSVLAGLSVYVHGSEGFVFNAMQETLRRTALADLEAGSLVNLERAMTPQARFGGHIVQGHVDGVGEVLGVTPEGDAELWEFAAPEAVLMYLVEKGSVCVDGISLTVVAVREGSFTVSILPQTKAATNMRGLSIGDRVNLEADVIAKYVERLLGPRSGSMQNLERSVEDAV